MADEKYQIVQRSYDFLKKLGVGMFPKPQDSKSKYLTLPTDITAEESGTIGKHLQAVTEMLKYLYCQHGEAETNACITDDRYQQRLNEAVAGLDEVKGMNVTQKKAAAKSNKKSFEYRRDNLQAESNKRFLEKLIQGYEADRQLLSREISRRSNDNEVD